MKRDGTLVSDGRHDTGTRSDISAGNPDWDRGRLARCDVHTA